MIRLLVVLAALLVPTLGLAISCVGSQSVREAYASEDNVFLSNVVELSSGSAFGRADVKLAKVQITRVFKGSLTAGALVEVTAEESVRFFGDGFVPSVGSELLVCSSGGNPLCLGVCSRTTMHPSRRELASLERLAVAKPGG